MPSPFPGMDPYLEAPDIWPDLHERLADQISAELNSSLPVPYYARLVMRPEVGIVEEEGVVRRIVPDVAVVRPHEWGGSAGAVAVLDRPRTEISRSFEVSVSSETIRHAFVEVRDPSRGHKLITLLEIVSPSNKRPGPDRKAYLQKQREILDSDASLVELDFLREGDRLLTAPELREFIERLDPTPDYMALVHRAWKRGGSTSFQVFPIILAEQLPCIPVPLRENQAEVLLDMQFVFNRVYDRGPYRRGAVDYARPPSVSLDNDRMDWAKSCVQAWLHGIV